MDLRNITVNGADSDKLFRPRAADEKLVASEWRKQWQYHIITEK